MPNVLFSLLVLKTRKLETLRAFYSALGIEFFEEQHGTGPTHYAAELGEAILEIYPLAEDENNADASTRLGFFVEDLGFVLESLWRNEFCELKKAKQTQWGYRAVVRDPDGRAVELCQQQD